MVSYKEDYGAAGSITHVDTTDDWTHVPMNARLGWNQSEANYDGVSTNGTWAQGSNYAVNDVITVTGGGRITVNTIDTGGEVLTFSVNSVFDSGGHTDAENLTQTGVVPTGGTGFSLTLGTANFADDSENASGMVMSIALKPFSITSVSGDDTIGAAENPWNITGTGFGAR